MTWSRGANALRRQIVSDEEIAAEDVAGVPLVSFDEDVRRALSDASPCGVELLELAELDPPAAVAYVMAHAPPGSTVVADQSECCAVSRANTTDA
jgi:hypothetical protein